MAIPSLDACQRDQANAFAPENSDITPEDARCILQRFLGLSSCLDFTGSRLIDVSGNNQRGTPGEVLSAPLVVRVEDQFHNPLAGVPVTFTRLVGDGTFASFDILRVSPDTRTLAQTGASFTVVTGADGTASVSYLPGPAALQVIAAQAPDIFNSVIFRVNLGPLAGNGTEPLNLTVGGGRGYVVNGGTRNVSVFDSTGQSSEVLAVIEFPSLQTAFGAGGVLGAAVDAAANRLYIYGVFADGAGESVVLLVLDTTTNTFVEPTDPDGDTRPGLTLFTPPASSSADRTSLSPSSILELNFGNLVTVDAVRGRVYAVVPGQVEAIAGDGISIPVTIDNGSLIAIEDNGAAPVIVARIPVGEVPTGVAVNTRTNRIYVTNRGFDVSDAEDDTVTVVDGSTLTEMATISVGQSPIGVVLDEVHNLIYVANLFGSAVSVIEGVNHTVVQTVPTSGTTDLAVLVGSETIPLATGTDRIYVNEGTVFDCGVTDLSVPSPCQIQPERVDLGETPKLAINDSNTLLLGAIRNDNRVIVFDLATNIHTSVIRTGVSVKGMAVDPQTGTIYVSDFLGDELLAVDPNGTLAAIPLFDVAGFGTPGQVEVDATNGRIYILSPNASGGAAGIPPLIALDQANPATLVATLDAEEFVAAPPVTLAIDTARNLVYLTASARGALERTLVNRLLVFDGAQLQGNTPASRALLAEIVVGAEEMVSADAEEFVQGLAVDTTRNLIYVARCGLFIGGCDPSRNALVVVRGPEIMPGTRALLRAPEVLATIPNIGLNFGGGQRNMALDLERNLIYIAGTSAGIGEHLGPIDITVLDGFKIVDAQGQVTSNPAAAVVGIIPIKMPVDLRISSLADFTSTEMAFDAEADLLYVVSNSTAPFSEGFISVINGDAVIDLDASRNFITTPHPTVTAALISLIATIPAGIEPQFISIDGGRNRVIVSNQARGALLVLRGLHAL